MQQSTLSKPKTQMEEPVEAYQAIPGPVQRVMYRVWIVEDVAPETRIQDRGKEGELGQDR